MDSTSHIIHNASLARPLAYALVQEKRWELMCCITLGTYSHVNDPPTSESSTTGQSRTSTGFELTGMWYSTQTFECACLLITTLTAMPQVRRTRSMKPLESSRAGIHHVSGPVLHTCFFSFSHTFLPLSLLALFTISSLPFVIHTLLFSTAQTLPSTCITLVPSFHISSFASSGYPFLAGNIPSLLLLLLLRKKNQYQNTILTRERERF